MCMPFPGCGQHSFGGALRVALIRLLSLVGRKRATLSVGQLSFFQLGHPTVSARVEGEVSRESNVLPQLLDKMLNRRTCIELRDAIVQRVKRFAKHARAVILREPVSFSLSAVSTAKDRR